MDALECIKTRMSIRKFKPEPVSKEILMSVFDTARWSPSYKNTQPWEAVIVSGSKKDELSKHLIEVFERGEKPRPDIPEPQSWPSHIDIRIKELFKKRSERFGIDFSDPEVGKRSKIANFRFYGAPHGIFLFQDASLPLWSLFDIGLFTQSLMLAAHSYGLGTVPQAFLTDYSDVVKKFLGIPESKRLVLGISIGYPDVEDKANSFRTDRVDVNEIVKWIQ
ncbi:NADH dehydrogenase [Dissulfurispira thermophila]|uniref:NADH dehydrogenase n=1 Tax=Dissulfurispira thermophila TaxID=2715679 RepID=A0A7G1H4F3_9BACT|nr:nitroreductase [Dissulfurispira thermophila]BCB96627.1 NADH dehydrogenase [Dissulfurispira thermophila]